MERNEATSMTEAERLAQALTNPRRWHELTDDECDAAAAELRRLSADARRYAWLRGHYVGVHAVGDRWTRGFNLENAEEACVGDEGDGARLDAAIDQAMDGK